VKGHGLKYAVVAYLMPGERGKDAAYYERFADQLNEAGAVGQAAGLTLGYHNHAFEFAPLPDGRRPLDVLISRLDPSLVTLELDVFWVAVAGADPVDLIRTHASRTRLLHLKDKSPSAPTVTEEQKVPPTAFAEVGNGTIDFAAVLAAAQSAGVQHLFVEQDHTPGDPIASLRQSYANLAKL
jgi:sugar phosphate isomerase/epimerase